MFMFMLAITFALATPDNAEDKYSPAARRSRSGPPDNEPVPDLSRSVTSRGAGASIWDQMPGSTQDKINGFKDIAQAMEDAIGQCFPDDMVPADYYKLLCVLFGGSESGLLHDNGPMVTRGNVWSDLDTSVFNIYGWGWQSTADNRLADDFSIPADYTWFVRNGATFGYQTGSSLNSTYTAVNYRLWDGVPGNASSSVLSGNVTLNYLSGTGWSGIYRTIINVNATNRPVMRNDMDLEVTVLTEGTYWFDVQATGSGALSGPWMPPVTVLNMTTTGNAMQYTGSWGNVLDNGYQQGIPFEIHGDSIPTECLSYYGNPSEPVVSFSDVYTIIQDYFAGKSVSQSEYDGFIQYLLDVMASMGAPQNILDAAETKLHELDGAVVTGGQGGECSAASCLGSWIAWI